MIARHLLPIALILGVLSLPTVLHHTILHVITPSLPPGWYFVEPFSHPHVGDYVVVCPPLALAHLGVSRGYFIPGDCPGSVAPLLKVLAAQDGDTVVLSTGGTVVNGVPVQTPIAMSDARHRPLAHVPFGTYRVRAGEIWLLGMSSNSWDSRYFGPLPSSAILGRAYPLLTNPAAVSR